MSLSSIRGHAQGAVLYALAIVTVLAAGAVVGTAADVEGPSLVMQNDDAAQPKQSVSPDVLAQPANSMSSEKSSESEQESETAEAEKKADPQQPAKKSEAAESLKKPDVAKADKQPTAKSPKTAVVGEAMAPGMVKLLQDEILAGLRRRGMTDRFARFQSYAAGRVNATAGKHTGSELTGNCRIRWYDHLMRNVLAAPAEAERFTRELHTVAIDNHEGLAKVLAIAATKMDAGERKPRKYTPPTSARQALEIVKQALTEAQISYCAALAPLGKSEIRKLRTYLVPVLSTQNQVGHTLTDRGTGRRLCDLMEKMDREALYSAAEGLAPLADVRVLEQLKSLPADGDVRVAGVTGPVAARIDTPSGTIVIGGRGSNAYQLDEMRDVAVVIDLGGGNTYYEGTVGIDRPVLIVANLDGHNAFRGRRPGIQGGAVLGISMLVNLGGNNTYEALDVAQGSALAGVGILIDFAGNNRYRGIRRVQGQAIGGLGILMSRGGGNDYHAAMWAQGFGGPLGFGMLDNAIGSNHYYCGGMWRDSYPETPGCEGWGQGVGAGIRQVASGGIGVILDGGGENVYEFDYLAHGGGYWCGLGFARDFGGNTKRLITRTAYNGGPRTQPAFQRFGSGWGCHYSLGFLFDDAGNDVYEGTIMGTGMAWDCAMGVLCDLAGNDHYKPTRGLTQGTGAQMGFGILFDYAGDDVYKGHGQGYAPSNISYHTLPGCGGNFSFLADYGGKDTYGCGAANNGYLQRGDRGGFLIDRPSRNEAAPTAKRQSSRTTAGS